DRAAGADAADEGVDLAIELAPNLGAGGLEVGARVLRIEILVGLESAGYLAGEAVGDAVIALGALAGHSGGGGDDLGAVCLEEGNLLLGAFVGHDEDALIAEDGVGDCEAG